jgi:transcription elongation factor Elf1
LRQAVAAKMVYRVLTLSTMDSALASSSAKDIVFNCQHCGSSLVVDAAAAGLTLTCQRCGKPTVVPADGSTSQPPPVKNAPLADLERQLKENEAQRTEVTGYINQLSIQLHRWKIRLQTLNERKTELEAELKPLKH